MRTLALLAALVLVGCGNTSSQTSDTHANTTNPDAAASAPVTDASVPPNKAPVGAPVRPLTNVPSFSLEPEGSEKLPAIAFLEKAGNGTAVRIVDRDSKPQAMPAKIVAAACKSTGTTIADLKPVKDGQSITTLPNLRYDKITTMKNWSVRVESPGGGDAQCGTPQTNYEPTR